MLGNAGVRILQGAGAQGEGNSRAQAETNLGLAENARSRRPCTGEKEVERALGSADTLFNNAAS
jgi:hypothetical protein